MANAVTQPAADRDQARLQLYVAVIRKNKLLEEPRLAEALEIHRQVQGLGVRLDLLDVLITKGLLAPRTLSAVRKLAEERGLIDPSAVLEDLPLDADLRLGHLAAENHLISTDQFEEALRIQATVHQLGLSKPMGQILVEKGYLRSDIVDSLLVIQEQLRRGEEATTQSDGDLVTTHNDLLFGSMAVVNGLVEPQELQRALHLQVVAAERTGLRLRIGEVLYGTGAMEADDVDALLKLQHVRQGHAGHLPAAVRLDEAEDQEIGRLLEANRMVSPEALRHGLETQGQLAALGMKRRLGEVLILLGALKEEEIHASLEVQRARKRRREKLSQERATQGRARRKEVAAAVVSALGALALAGPAGFLLGRGSSAGVSTSTPAAASTPTLTHTSPAAPTPTATLTPTTTPTSTPAPAAPAGYRADPDYLRYRALRDEATALYRRASAQSPPDAAGLREALAGLREAQAALESVSGRHPGEEGLEAEFGPLQTLLYDVQKRTGTGR